jgi:hypothetical protein
MVRSEFGTRVPPPTAPEGPPGDDVGGAAVTLRELMDWRDAEIEVARARGEKIFLDFPTAWFEDPSWMCENGHVSGMHLKSDEGDKCLECRRPVALGPPWCGEAKLAEVMAGIRKGRAVACAG